MPCLAVLAAACGEVKVVPGLGDSAAQADGALDGLSLDSAAKDKAPTVQITSPAPGVIVNVGAELHFSASISDDKDVVNTLKVKWTTTASATALFDGLVDGSGISDFKTSSVPSGAQKVTVAVTDSAGNVATADVGIVINTAPGAPDVGIAPDKPTTLDDLTATILQDATDPDRAASSLTYSYLWLKNGTPTEFKAKVLPNSATAKGETWSVKVKANDPKAEGPEGSAQVVIVNAVPVAPALEVSPTTVDLQSEVKCAMAVTATDPDGDPVTYEWTWSIGDYVNPGADGDTVQMNDLASGKDAQNKDKPVKAGDSVKCSVVVKDADSSAAKVESPAVVIQPFDICGSAFNPCDLAASCSNTDTLAPVCTCPSGFTGDGKICLDINECFSGLCDLAADCTNTVGSYTCGCKTGYQGDGKFCSDVDECVLGTAGCDLAADCTNTLGSYDCVCKTGFAGDGKTCADVDECAAGTSTCSLTADCENTVGGFTCACKTGYFDDPSAGSGQAGKTCTDIDECTDGSSGCDVNAQCTNIPGANLCACNAGFVGNGKVCVDVDECIAATSPCSNDGLCANKPGTFTCACKPGFAGDGKACNDVNECTAGTTDCDKVLGVCTNKPGTFVCSCTVGYSGNGKTCFDIDECANGSAGCAVKSTCNNTVGGYQCTCLPGYFGDGKSCEKEDMCTPTACPTTATCATVNGAAQCKCKAGYSGSACGDINECATNNGGCSINGVCTNTVGSSSCACKSGYSGDGKTCSDVNECAVSNGGCSAQAGCTNTLGSFTCACKAGFTGDGKTCADVNECAVNNGGCSPNAACTNSPGTFKCACKAGFLDESGGAGKVCNDVNECAANNGGCSADAACTNSVGSFSCACKAGFTGNGKTCADTNECAVSNGGCSSFAACTNTPGSFQCQCNSGFTGDGKVCTDINECPLPEWTWNFTKQGGVGWVFDPPSATTAPVKWQVFKDVMYYGNSTISPTNFNTPGTANHGAATGPSLTLSNAPSHRLTFDADFQTEFGLPYDALTVQLVIKGQPTPVTLPWTKSKQIQGAGFHTYAVAMSGYAGKTVQLRFYFDTVDAAVNQAAGLFVKDLSIVATGNPCSIYAACTNTPGSYTCKCDAPYEGDGKTCAMPGSQELPADSCLSIFNKTQSNGQISAGLYWLLWKGGPAAAQYLCNAQGWTQISYDAFEGNQAGGWNPPLISTTCGGGLLGGPGISAAGYTAARDIAALPPHSLIQITGQYLRVDSWDGEMGWVKVDGATYWQSPSYVMAAAGGPGNLCGVATYPDSMTSIVAPSGSMAHNLPSAKITIGSTLDQSPNDESFAVDNIKIQVR